MPHDEQKPCTPRPSPGLGEQARFFFKFFAYKVSAVAVIDSHITRPRHEGKLGGSLGDGLLQR